MLWVQNPSPSQLYHCSDVDSGFICKHFFPLSSKDLVGCKKKEKHFFLKNTIEL